MNNTDYLSALKKALSGMSRSSRDEVLQEIQSHISESGADGATLMERFGTPETLAQQYLEGETLRTPITQKAGGIGKKLLMLIDGAALLLIALIALAIYLFAPDDFNYADDTSLTDNKGGIEIRQKSCLVYLPKQPLTLTGNQADIVLVKPQADVSVNVRQSQLRIAENGEQYRYEISAQRSKTVGLNNFTEATHTIKIEAMEADLGLYEE